VERLARVRRFRATPTAAKKTSKKISKMSRCVLR
jgi:hypothetical protein